jgi:glycosyltransferase involved in cell wall biosynthesis
MWVSMGIPQDKIEVIPFGVDTNIFNPNMDDRSVRDKLKIKEDDITIISTRPLFNHHYNVECLVKAIPIVLNEHRNVKFIIKGVGPLEDYLRNLAKNLNVYENVRFVGLMPYNEIAKYLVASDIYVSTSFYDSTSVSLLEAMACGLPPVTTDIAGNREWIQNERNGLLYPPQNYKALAEGITKLVEHEDLRKRFGERNRDIVLERAAWEKCVSKMEAVYQSIA